MNRATPAQTDLARRLLTYEGSNDGAGVTSAASRVYDKLHQELAVLLGDAGVHSLFIRSAKLAQGEFASLAGAAVISSSRLREWLQMQGHTADDATAALFANLIALTTTFIGERLTMQVLRRAWPRLEEMAPLETQKE